MLGSRLDRGAVRLALCLFLLGLSSAACLGADSRPMRLQDAAQNLNIATRFGRMDVALENVSSKAQLSFAQRHAAWGPRIRVVDVEFGGMQFIDNSRALIFVAISWQRLDEQDLRVTQIAQSWQYEKSSWKLIEERTTGGDASLFETQAGAPNGSAPMGSQVPTAPMQ